MTFFNIAAKKAAKQNGGMFNMFSVLVNLFNNEGFIVDKVTSTSIILKNETELAISVMKIKLINESSIKILFLMNFLDGTQPQFMEMEEYYNLTQTQEDIYYQLINKVDKEIGKRC